MRKQGCGLGSLDDDADDLRLLAGYLRKRQGVLGLVLMGYSTGCQVRVRVRW